MQGSRSTRGASRRSCDRCGASVLRQLVGQRAALKVTADAEPIPLDEAAALTGPNRLAWCLARLRNGDVELRWQCWTRNGCDHEVVIDHQCAPEIREFGRRPEGGLW